MITCSGVPEQDGLRQHSRRYCAGRAGRFRPLQECRAAWEKPYPDGNGATRRSLNGSPRTGEAVEFGEVEETTWRKLATAETPVLNRRSKNVDP